MNKTIISLLGAAAIAGCASAQPVAPRNPVEPYTLTLVDMATYDNAAGQPCSAALQVGKVKDKMQYIRLDYFCQETPTRPRDSAINEYLDLDGDGYADRRCVTTQTTPLTKTVDGFKQCPDYKGPSMERILDESMEYMLQLRD